MVTPRGWAERRHLVEIGNAPDPRFSFANERTFLAWTRTSLALIVAGGAVAQFADSLGTVMRAGVTVALIGIGAAVSLASYGRWRRAEVAMRLGQPPPPSRAPAYIGFSLGVIGVATACAMAVRLLS